MSSANATVVFFNAMWPHEVMWLTALDGRYFTENGTIHTPWAERDRGAL